MIELGLVLLIQSGLSSGSPPVTNVPGGFADELPKDWLAAPTPMAWTYRTITDEPDFVLAGETGRVEWHVQIDCHGNGPADAIALMRGIQKVLRGGYRGALPDPDSTYVFDVIRQGPSVSGFSDASRTWVRSLEYNVIYQQI